MTKVSVIVPVYKVENYIRKCIESIISQTYKDWELILVDDGSPDNSGDICDNYAALDSRICVIHKENAGVGAARNTGIDHATGEYIAFVDSDDFCDKTYLENFEFFNLDYDLVIQGFKKFILEDECPGRVFQKNLYIGKNIIYGLLENSLLSFGAPYCKLFKRDIIKKYNIKFSTNYSFGEDTYFFFDYLIHISSLKMVDQSGYFYRCQQQGSLSEKNHGFDDLVKFANDSLDLIRVIDCDNRLEYEYSRNYVGLYARALANMYRLKYNRKKRIDCIKQLKDRRLSNIKMFKGFTSYKIVFLFARKSPIFLVDFILYIHYIIKD